MANSVPRWIGIGLVFIALDVAAISLRTTHPIHPWPWQTLLLWWTVLLAGSFITQHALKRWRPKQSRPWALIALSLVVGSQAGFSFMGAEFGGFVGATMGLIAVHIIPSKLVTATTVLLLGSWVITVLMSTEALQQTDVPGEGPDIIVVTIDTVREDALSSSPRALISGLTPTLDRLAKDGCQVDQATSTSPLTGPSHAAMFSGRHPIDLGLFKNGRTLPEDLPWLPSILKERGYQTAGFVSSAMLDGTLGYSRGFQTYDDDQSGTAALSSSTLSALFPTPTPSRAEAFSRHGSETIERMQRWLERADSERPIFVWLHLYDAHRPYVASASSVRFVENAQLALPPPSAFMQWSEPPATAAPSSIATKIFSELRQTALQNSLEPGPDTMPLMYLAGVRDLDALVERAWAQLDEARPKSERVWAVVSDHGESLTEHGELGSHQHNVYEANLRVPYLLSPGPCPTVPTSTVGLAETLLKRAGIDEKWTSEEGLDAVVRASEKAPSHPSMLKLSRRVGDQKIVVGLKDGESQFTESYDLAADRHELRPLSEPPAPLTGFISSVLPRLTDPPTVLETDHSVQQALRALGYIDEEE